MTDDECRKWGIPTEQERANAYWDAVSAYRSAWEDVNHIAWFETEATLYRLRYRRLAPGKDDPFHDSSDAENRARMDAYRKSGLLHMDTVMALAKAWARIEQLEDEADD